MGSTALGFPYPPSTASPRVWEDIAALAEALNAILTLPAATTGYGDGVNTIVATEATWSALPTYAATASLTNPHATRGLLVAVSGSAWLSAAGGNLRACVVGSGGVTVGAGVGAGGGAGWGEVMLQAAPESGTAYSSASTTYTATIPAGTTATFVFNAYRDTAVGTQRVNYPTIRVTPLRYL